MAIKDIFKVSRKTFFDPTAWIGWETLRDQSVALWAILKGAYATEKPTRTETFAEAVKRQKLTKADVEEAEKDYYFYAVIFLILGITSVIYGFFLLIHYATIAGFILSLAVCALFLSQAFRFHFWYFQIKKRKLGCTFQEWKRDTFNLKKGHEK